MTFIQITINTAATVLLSLHNNDGLFHEGKVPRRHSGNKLNALDTFKIGQTIKSTEVNQTDTLTTISTRGLQVPEALFKYNYY